MSQTMNPAIGLLVAMASFWWSAHSVSEFTTMSYTDFPNLDIEEILERNGPSQRFWPLPRCLGYHGQVLDSKDEWLNPPPRITRTSLGTFHWPILAITLYRLDIESVHSQQAEFFRVSVVKTSSTRSWNRNQRETKTKPDLRRNSSSLAVENKSGRTLR